MPRKQVPITLNRLREVLRYDPKNGNLVWIINRTRGVKIGDIAGSLHPQGYIMIGIDGDIYSAHRLAWWLKTGVEPTAQIDHKNRIRRDNRWCNLRAATHGQNQQNANVPKHSTSGIRGVSFTVKTGKWRAHIGHNKIRYYLGEFDTKGEAASVRKRYEKSLFGKFSNP